MAVQKNTTVLDFLRTEVKIGWKIGKNMTLLQCRDTLDDD